MVESIATRPQPVSISVTDVARARVTNGPVTIPIAGGVYARLKNVTVVPSGTSGDSVSYLRLRALDSMIGRLRAEESMVRRPDESQLEHQQRILEEAAKRIADDSGVDAGLLLNVSA